MNELPENSVKKKILIQEVWTGPAFLYDGY